MHHHNFMSIIAISLVCSVPQVTHAFQGKRGTTVNAVNDTVFEVIARTAGSAQDYWCGAADYARIALGAPWSASISIVRGRGPSETTIRKSAVQFSLDPVPAAEIAQERPIIQFGKLARGHTMTVRNAFEFCVQPVGRR